MSDQRKTGFAAALLALLPPEPLRPRLVLPGGSTDDAPLDPLAVHRLREDAEQAWRAGVASFGVAPEAVVALCEGWQQQQAERGDVAMLVKRATEALAALDSLPDDVLGIAPNDGSSDWTNRWYIKDALIARLCEALAAFAARSKP